MQLFYGLKAKTMYSVSHTSNITNRYVLIIILITGNWKTTIWFCRIKTGILDALTRETESVVRNAVAQLIGCIAKHELVDGKWPEMLNFLQSLSNQANPSQRELGLFTLSVVAESAGEEFKPFLKPFLSTFRSALQDTASAAAYHTTITLKNLIPFIGSEEAVRIWVNYNNVGVSHDRFHFQTMIQPLIPKVVLVVKKLVASDEMKAVQAMEIWEELLETELSLLAPHLKGIQTELMNYGSIHFLKRMINNRRCRTLSWDRG